MTTPLSYQIDSERRVVRVRYHAQPEFLEWAAAMRSIFKEAAFGRGFGILLDRQDITEAASALYIRQMVRFIETEGVAAGTGRWAVLVSNLVSFGVGRMAQGWSSTDTIGVFTVEKE